jgi:hypothetical protein
MRDFKFVETPHEQFALGYRPYPALFVGGNGGQSQVSRKAIRHAEGLPVSLVKTPQRSSPSGHPQGALGVAGQIRNPAGATRLAIEDHRKLPARSPKQAALFRACPQIASRVHMENRNPVAGRDRKRADALSLKTVAVKAQQSEISGHPEEAVRRAGQRFDVRRGQPVLAAPGAQHELLGSWRLLGAPASEGGAEDQGGQGKPQPSSLPKRGLTHKR